MESELNSVKNIFLNLLEELGVAQHFWLGKIIILPSY